VKPSRAVLAVVLLGAMIAVSVYRWRGAGALSVPAAGAAAQGPLDDLPLIDLARLEARRQAPAVGRRDVFDFGQARSDAASAVAPPAPPPPVSLAVAPPLEVVSTTAPGPPPLNVRYVGSVERKDGLHVAVMLTDRQEVLTGQTGDTVANRFRIVKIGYESVDIQDVGSDRVRRIPYKGN